jgi:enediyne polyketide synthase
LRFLDCVRVHYPRVQLIVETEISWQSDPYFADHAIDGEDLFSGVLGLEPMAQVAMALTGIPVPPCFENVAFRQSVRIPPSEPICLRVVALARDDTTVDTALRSSTSEFQIDRFRTTCRFAPTQSLTGDRRQRTRRLGTSRLPFSPAEGIYGKPLFHQGRLQCLPGYRWLSAKECLAEICPIRSQDWFDRTLAPILVLGDPGALDAAIHAIQACIPHAAVLPNGVERLEPGLWACKGPWLQVIEHHNRPLSAVSVPVAAALLEALARFSHQEALTTSASAS